MAAPIIFTKLHIPAQPRVLVPRQRLTARLDAGIPGKLILVSAPAGFGKTSLIAEWAHQCAGKFLVSWVHLDENDNEIARFLSYIIAALQTHRSDIGEAALSGLQSVPPVPTEAILASLINEISSIQSEIILILDDYHLIDTGSIHEAVGFFIEHLPAHVCLVIATRTDPPLPIHRFRARGQMTEIRADDLRFNSEETRNFLEGILQTSFSPSDIAALESRVEGWAAGLQMVALSMQGKQNVHEFIETFSGSHRYIMDYLTEEIFNQQPPHIQRFLLKTSILDRLSGSLCDFVIGKDLPVEDFQEGSSSAQQMLEYLEHANLFLLPLDDERCWYRYHHLFASLLRQRLRLTLPNEIRVTLQRASDWCSTNDYIDESIKYALVANATEAAADLVETHALGFLNKGALSTVSGWLRKLPEETILGRPWLSVFSGWTSLLSGKFEYLERYLGAAEAGQITPENGDGLRGHITAIHAYALAMQGDSDHAIDLANQALRLLPKDDLSIRCVVSFVIGGVYFMRRDMPNVLEAMKEAGRAGEQGGNIHLAVSALSAAGDILRSQGSLTEAKTFYDRALKLGTGSSGRPLPIAASVFSSLAELHLARNNLENARQFAVTGVELANQWGNIDSLAGSYLALAQIARIEGNPEEATLALDEAKRLSATHNLTPGFKKRISAIEALILQGGSESVDRGFPVDPLTERELEVLSTSLRVAERLKGLVIFPLREEDYRQVLIGEATNLHKRYYFEWASRIKNETVQLVQEMGIFVIAAINFFHYPRHARQALAAQDIQRLLNAGVDGFQIDDEFREFLQHKS